jgi:hypothetical protein
MAAVSAKSHVREASIEAVITRANGTVENLGMISYYHRNPLRRFAWQLRKLLRMTR